MRRIYIPAALLLAACTTHAQQFMPLRADVSKVVTTATASVASGNDTLGLAEFGTQFITYIDPQAGYTFGTASLTEQTGSGPITIRTAELAAGFLVNTTYSVKGAAIVFGAKEATTASPANLAVKAYSLAENKAIGSASSTAPDAIGPDQMLVTVALPFADVQYDETAVVGTFVDFATPFTTTEDFAIAVDIAGLYGASQSDTVAVCGNANNASTDGAYTWAKQAAVGLPISIWGTAKASGAGIQLAIFAIVQEAVGVEDAGLINGVGIKAYPSPAASYEDIRIDYELAEGASNVNILVFDMTGRTVLNVNEANRPGGKHSLTIPAGSLNAGAYVYAIDADGRRIAKRMEVVK